MPCTKIYEGNTFISTHYLFNLTFQFNYSSILLEKGFVKMVTSLLKYLYSFDLDSVLLYFLNMRTIKNEMLLKTCIIVDLLGSNEVLENILESYN